MCREFAKRSCGFYRGRSRDFASVRARTQECGIIRREVSFVTGNTARARLTAFVEAKRVLRMARPLLSQRSPAMTRRELIAGTTRKMADREQSSEGVSRPLNEELVIASQSHRGVFGTGVGSEV